MPHFEELYPGRFLKGVTLAKPKTIRITAFAPEALENDDGKKVPKAILKYRDKDGEGEMVCCKTNAALIAAMYGPDFSTWPGKLVTLHFDTSVRFGAEKPGGIRVLGAPELAKALEVTIKRPRRKKPEVYLLQPTGAKPAQQPAGAPPPAESVPLEYDAMLNECQTQAEYDAAMARITAVVPKDAPYRTALDRLIILTGKRVRGEA